MNKNPKEENKMDLLIGVIIPVAIILFNYYKGKYEEKNKKETYQSFVKQFAEDVRKELLPPKS